MPTPSEAALDSALARAVLYRALKLGFARLEEAVQEETGEVLLRAARRLAPELEDAARQVARSGPSPSAADSEAYDRLFGHTARGRVCPYESEYGSEAPFAQFHELADIAGCYLAFGMQPGAEERVDHVAVELEFMEFLARKEAYALEVEAGAMTEQTSAAARAFLRDHLSRFGRALALRLAAEDPGGPYGALGRLLEALLAFECRRLDLPEGPAFVALRRDAEEPPAACGTGSELVEIDE